MVCTKTDKEISNLGKQIHNRINHVSFLQIPLDCSDDSTANFGFQAVISEIVSAQLSPTRKEKGTFLSIMWEIPNGFLRFRVLREFDPNSCSQSCKADHANEAGWLWP